MGLTRVLWCFSVRSMSSKALALPVGGTGGCPGSVVVPNPSGGWEPPIPVTCWSCHLHIGVPNQHAVNGGSEGEFTSKPCCSLDKYRWPGVIIFKKLRVSSRTSCICSPQSSELWHLLGLTLPEGVCSVVALNIGNLWHLQTTILLLYPCRHFLLPLRCRPFSSLMSSLFSG